MSKYETYNYLKNMNIEEFDDLRGVILTKIEANTDEIRFYLTDTIYARLYHEQDCCESVTVEDIVGDLDDLIEVPLLMVEETSENDDKNYQSGTWTYYRIRTIKGSVDIRWLGESNGYYSESVDFEIVGLD
jgi:hypothetical protein